jgi:hypothetical protein
VAKKPGKAKSREVDDFGKAANGRPPYEPTEENRNLVRVLKSVGADHDLIGMQLGISRSTLERYFRIELDKGKEVVKAVIGSKLVGKALSGNLTAQIFFLKTQAGWKEGMVHTNDPENPMPGGGPAQVVIMLPDNGRGDAGPPGG